MFLFVLPSSSEDSFLDVVLWKGEKEASGPPSSPPPPRSRHSLDGSSGEELRGRARWNRESIDGCWEGLASLPLVRIRCRLIKKNSSWKKTLSPPPPPLLQSYYVRSIPLKWE